MSTSNASDPVYTNVELSDNLSSFHAAPNYGSGLHGDLYDGLTTTDPSAPLGGTYSLLSNTGINAEAPITYDFLHHKPNTREDRSNAHIKSGYMDANVGVPNALPDRTGPRFDEIMARDKHRIAHYNAQRAFQDKQLNDYNAAVGDYEYGTGYALDSSSPNYGKDPRPALYDDILYADGIGFDGSFHDGMGYDYAYSEKNYGGYDPLAYTTLNENGVTEYTDRANTIHPDAPLIDRATGLILDSKGGGYFNTGRNLKKFSVIPISEFGLNPATHNGSPEIDARNLLKPAQSSFNQEEQFFNQGESPNSLLMPPSGMDSTGGGGGFGLGYGSGTGTGLGLGNYSRGYQKDILGLLDNLLGG